MLNSKKETFRLLEDIFGKGENKVEISISGEERHLNFMANLALDVLDHLDEYRKYVYYNDGLHSNLLSMELKINEDPDSDEYVHFMLFLDEHIGIKPYYLIQAFMFGNDTDEDKFLDYCKTYRKNRKDSEWQKED